MRSEAERLFQLALDAARDLQPEYADPILILWKRAGLAPWPVPITCSGWPLPQLGTPHSVQCSAPAMASQAFQKSVEIPL